MFTPYVDFHTHSLRSDGRLSPWELVRSAYDAGIRVMSITDHNYTESLEPLRAAFPEMILVQGAEISAMYEDRTGTEHELHIVALGFDPEDPELKAMLVHNQPDRKPYIDAILKRLREECGIDLGTYEDIRAQLPDNYYIGRMALARVMTQRGITASVDEAFDRYLGSHGQRLAYVKNPLRYLSLEETLRRIIGAGGTPVLAHLLYYDLDSGNRIGGPEKERLVRRFRQLVDAFGGVGGMEVYYTRYKTVEERLYLLGLCRKYGLLISAGSDYHHQEQWETLAHRTSCSVCGALLAHLGVTPSRSLEPGALAVVSGFSGVGKGEVCKALEGRSVDGRPLAVIRSVTSRPRRAENENYTFVTREEFARLVAEHQLLEHNDAYNQNGYGTPVWEVRRALEAGKMPLLEIDRVGLCRLLTDGRIDPGLIRSVFLVARAEDVANRLSQRKTENGAAVHARLRTAIQESRHLGLYDAVVENAVVEDAARAVLAALEGRPGTADFDPAAFRQEMEAILAGQAEAPQA